MPTLAAGPGWTRSMSVVTWRAMPGTGKYPRQVVRTWDARCGGGHLPVLDWSGSAEACRFPMRHAKQMRVRFGHSDPARIVYYPRFFEWFHDIFESMFEEVFHLHYAAVLSRWGVGFPAVQVACEFKKPATFGELVDIEVFLSRLAERSATFEYRVRREGELLVTASVKVAAMDLATHQSTEIPEALRAAFAPYVEPDVEMPNTQRIR